jgi:hypothetical protein
VGVWGRLWDWDLDRHFMSADVPSYDFSPVVSEFSLIFFLLYSCYWSLLLSSFGSCSEILTRGTCFCFVSCDDFYTLSWNHCSIDTVIRVFLNWYHISCLYLYKLYLLHMN